MPASIKTVENKLHTIKMEGNILFKHAVKLLADAALSVTEPLGLKGDDIDIIIPHQANIRILNALAKRMGVDPEKKLYLNIEKYGNMSAASSAVALTEAVEVGRIKPHMVSLPSIKVALKSRLVSPCLYHKGSSLAILESC